MVIIQNVYIDNFTFTNEGFYFLKLNYINEFDENDILANILSINQLEIRNTVNLSLLNASYYNEINLNKIYCSDIQVG